LCKDDSIKSIKNLFLISNLNGLPTPIFLFLISFLSDNWYISGLVYFFVISLS
jgi:hypothetical protein